MLLGQSRVFFSMSKDGLLPKMFSTVHPKFRTPWISSITVGLVVAVFASTIPLDALGEMTKHRNIAGDSSSCVRRRDGAAIEAESGVGAAAFRAPLFPATAILGILISLAMMLGLPLMTWYRLFIWLAVGLLIYFLYGKNHSLVGAEGLAASEVSTRVAGCKSLDMLNREGPGRDAGLFAGVVKISSETRYSLDHLWKSW